jgi:hypothetical protein
LSYLTNASPPLGGWQCRFEKRLILEENQVPIGTVNAPRSGVISNMPKMAVYVKFAI